jgi:outer membrane protein assembly factor BamB
MPAEYLFIGCNGHVAAVKPGDGREVWRTRLMPGILSATTHHDVCILEHADCVYAGCSGHLFCLDASSGRILWHNDLKGMGYNDVTLAMAGKLIQFVAKYTHTENTTST